MRNFKILIGLVVLMVLFINVECKKATQISLTVSANNVLITNANDTVTFVSTADSLNLNVQSTATPWTLADSVGWIQFSHTTGSTGSTIVKIVVNDNPATSARSAKIKLSAKNVPDVIFFVSQAAAIYNSYNISPLPADRTGMGSDAGQIASKIMKGINIGNTLEAIGGETAWGNPIITQGLIDLIKSSGFNAIRLPCSWDQYADKNTAQISPTWLSRVKQVVQYCINDSMYVILNIHWDDGWLENNCTVAKQVSVNAKQKAYWEQIATEMRDFDYHLMFASANEPNVTDDIGMSVLFSYHQTFVKAVRSTGGKNAFRVLVVQGPNTDIPTTNSLMSSLPADKVNNRMMVEVHYYTPYQFTGLTSDQTWGNMFYYWGSGYHSTTDLSRNASCCE